MKNRSSLLFAAALLAASCTAPVWAQTTPAPATPSTTTKTPAAPATGKTLTPQQQKMSECSTANKGKTGEAYKAGVASCLKGEKPAETGKTLTPQQQRMKDCNAQAGTKSLSGDARKTFMSTCLKGKS